MRVHAGRVAHASETLALPRAPQLSLSAQTVLLKGWLVLADSAALALAFYVAYWARFDLGVTVAPEVVPDPRFYPALASILVPVWLAVFAVFRLYESHGHVSGIVESSRAFNACTTATMLVIVATFVFPQLVIARGWLASAWLFSVVAVGATRFVSRRLVYGVRRQGYLLTPTIIVGTNQEAVTLASYLREWGSSGVRLIGFVSSEHSEQIDVPGLPVVGSLRDIRALVRQHGVEDVMVAITAVEREELLWLADELEPVPGVSLGLSSGLYEMLTTRVTVGTFGAVPLLRLAKVRLAPEEVFLKSAVEYPLTVLGVALLSPLLLAIAAIVKWESPGPVLHRRRVLGVGGRPFDAYKFRTMHVDGEARLRGDPAAMATLAAQHKLLCDPRVTRVGKWLRRYSLDELPQLFNVLKGQMSLVGPRMITAAETGLYGHHRMSLFTVRPGLTGLWQVSGRSDLSYEERVKIDLYYVRNYSIWLDLQILFVQTIPAVLRGRGAY